MDREFLTRLGVRVEVLNDKPGKVAHTIVPEGEGLAACKAALTDAHRRDPSFRLGYTADNDGDRGNLVFINSATGEAEELHAQEVFALAAVAELAWNELVTSGGATPALVVNGPTSLRVDEIARRWNAELYRSEVGEANVIDRALELEDKRVIIMGEGSNGGNITPPSLVRDPLSTVGAMIKLARSEAYDSWFRKSSLPVPDGRDLWALVKALPAYVTTGAYEARAILSIRTANHDALKSAYEAIFPTAFEKEREWLEDRFGVVGYRVVNYEGTVERHGPGNRTGDGRGGFKVELLDKRGRPRGFLWMRGSKTEPAFRIMADLAGGDPEDEAALLRLHAELVRAADRSGNKTSGN